MPGLVLGPILRWVGETGATVWLQTDAPCEVSILGSTDRTFCVEGRHYALLHVTGLQPGTTTPYEVALDGRRAWPADGDGLPPSVLRTPRADGSLDVVFGSCRVTAPHRPPFTQEDVGPERARGIDALRTLGLRMAGSSPDAWPDLLLMLGDQIYADDLSPQMQDRVGDWQLNSFDDYALAYEEAWGEPVIRWLLSVLPTAMVFDDHEIHAEWKISQAWLDHMRRQPWYDDRITAGLSAYWIYQHLGNLTPAELEESELLRGVRAQADGGPLLREHAKDADRQPGHSRWSYRRDFGRTRLVVIDSRAGREVAPGERQMIDDGEWAWLEQQVTGDVDHLLIASSVPFFLVEGLHGLEAWNEAVCDGAWGRRMAVLGERMRDGLVLDHWAAFQTSFHRFARLLEEVATGARGTPPRSVVLLSGDVHHSYLAEIGFRRDGGGPRAPVWQAVCSPYRKELAPRERAAMRFGASRAGTLIGRALERSVGIRRRVGWRVVAPPGYDNQVATLSVRPEGTRLRVETTVGSRWDEPQLHDVFERRLIG